MSSSTALASEALNKAKHALRLRDFPNARIWAEKATQLNPQLEDPWLILGALSEPQSSVIYLKKALEINPQSERARKGLDWAIQRLRSFQQPSIEVSKPFNSSHKNKPAIQTHITWRAITRYQTSPLNWLFLFVLMASASLGWFSLSGLFNLTNNRNPIPIVQLQIPNIFNDQISPTAEPSLPTPNNLISSNTPTATPYQPEAITPTPLPTSTPTDTPTSIPTLPLPTSTTKPQRAAGIIPPSIVGPGERWVDVDLSKQQAYAYQGEQLIRSFVVSTGTARYPTITGTFRIYVKYRYAPMSGPGYYLPNVPYVMYFYKGYGLHGTYWHNNFGTPMSHGCINFRTEDAAWLFDWTFIGTVVNIHP